MGDIQEPQARVGGAHTGGTNPYPGGTTDTGDVDLPPYEGRSSGGDAESKSERAESVERMLEDTVSEGDDEIGRVSGGDGAENVDPSTGEAGDPISAGEVSGGGGGSETPDPHGVGESDSQRGETFESPASEHKGATQRPVGQVEGDLMEPNNSGAGTSDVN
ncbi:MAG TPA: hypothetical protein VM942_02430 [Acidimicrobiales bacterium]|nr:hypothetical protein [Acidimicrobiales bacterium]